MEEDSSRIISYQDASKSPTEENNRPTPVLPSPSRSPSADNFFSSLSVPTSVVGSTRIPNSHDSADSGLGMDISVLQPPQVGGGKPMHIKRGPGRPRKDGAGKNPKPVISQKIKKLTGLFLPSGGRGIRGRKKVDGGSFVGGTNSISGTLGDLNLYNHESPPRFMTMEDTAESDSSSVASSFEKLHEDFSLFPEQWPGKLCALCNLGERSMLGQGELIRVEIPVGFDPQSVSKGLSISCKSEKDNSSDRSPKPAFSARRQKGVKIKRLISQGSLESMNEPVDEVVGSAEEPDLNNIFDLSTGFYYVHISCALWCGEVIRNSEGSFKHLEKEIVRALSQHCSHCGNLGAGITCKAPGCGCSLHFACAATSGGFQESSSRTTLCVSHIDLAVAMLGKGANCTVCNQPGSISSLLMCCTCNNHYHSACLALNSDPTIRAGWQCPACKVCQACRQPGDDSKLLPCDACDKVYHIFCLRPALTSCPKYSWKCKMCRICTDCGARTPGSGPSSRWHANFSVCDSCYQQRNKGLACPLCGKAYRHVAQKHMVQCHQCKKYVHDTCDPAADLNAYQLKKEQNPDFEYTCRVCMSPPIGLNPANSHPRVLLSLKRSSDKDDLSSESSSMFNSFTLSQDSFLSPEDDSQPGTENSNDLNWAEKNPSVVLEEIRPLLTSAGRGKPLSVTFPKKKLGVGRPRSIDKQGTLNSANNRRQRITELQRKRGPKPKMRGVFGAPGVGLQRPCTDVSHKCEDEPGQENRLVLCSSRDEFVLHQDVCVMCGAFGNDLEGRLISCAQCGQCYHPFCVNIKVTKVVLQKGWRCLDCTVCEGCGQRNDEARLILCDDCDISFHIYCMDPPLDYVPQGNWKCKWCVVCQLCGSNDPGLNCVWHNNYTLCGPCTSLNYCPVCKGEYTEGELIIQCARCDRWLHASCDMINSENEAEKCADDGYNCVLCRPNDVLPPHLQPPPAPVVAKVSTPPRSPEPKSRPPQSFVVDGVSLSETGMSHIKSLTMEHPRKKRKKVSNIADLEAGILAAIESVVSGSNCDARPESSESERVDEASEKDKESNKKKQRNLQKLGIGGFIVRMRGPRFKDDDDTGVENQSSMDGEKPKRKQARKKIKNKIVESFPSYLQEAFFGKTLMEPSKESDFVSGDEIDAAIAPKITSENYVMLSAEELKAIEATKAKQELNQKPKPSVGTISRSVDAQLPQNDIEKTHLKQQIKIEEEEDAEDALQDILPLPDLLDNDLVNTIMNEGDDIKVSDGLEDLGGDSALGDDGDLSLDHNGGDGNHKDELTDFLRSQFNLESIDTGLPSMDSKDVEDIFKGVLTDESQESQDNLFPISSAPPPPPNPHAGATAVQPTSNPSSQLLSQTPNINPSVISTPGVQGSPGLPSRSQLQQSVQQGLASPISFPPPSPYHSEYSNSPQFSPAFSEPPSPWPTQVDSEQETPSNYSQRSILKWEVDEALGVNATISAVLYANTNHAELKREFPNWAERSKQIAKIWRGLSSDKRAPYLQKARENRAASRMQKSQQDQDKLGSGPITKPSLRGETSEERHWKQMQVFRQQQHQHQQIVLQEHRLQGEPSKDHLGGGSAMNPSPKLQYSTAMAQVQRQLGNDVGLGSSGPDINRQPLQVTTTHEISMPAPQSSPHLQSPNSRQVFTTSLPGNRPRPPALEMPPPSPSPHYSPRPGMTTQTSPSVRPPMFSRVVPYMHSPRQMASPGDPYANSPMTPQPPSDPYSHPPSTPRPASESDSFPGTPEPYQKIMTDSYGNNNVNPTTNEMDISGGLSSPRPQPPQGQETRQHLRDLLQRQQIKKMEQEQMSPGCPELSSPGASRSLSWSPDDWQKGNSIDPSLNQNFNQRHQLSSPSSPQLHQQQNQFRHPFLPPHGRMGNQPQQQQAMQSINRPLGPEFRPGAPGAQQQQPVQGLDSRVRLLLQQQQRIMSPQQQQQVGARSQLNFQIGHQQQLQQQQSVGSQPQFRPGMSVRNPLDPYDHLVVQQRPGVGIPSDGNGPQVSGSSMLAQQLGRPLNSMVNQQQISVASPPPSMQHGGTTPHLSPNRTATSNTMSANHNHSVISSQGDHQELPDSVTAELEKLEQEQHNDPGVEGETGELGDMTIDDDELLGMGADFNILEYADPELDQAVGGEKTNILDTLDLEEDKEEEKEENKDLKRKELEKHVKRETTVTSFSSLGGPVQGSPNNVIPKMEPVAPSPNTMGISNTQSNYVQHQPPISQQQSNVSDGSSPALRPPQPPPPYPVPPPPYPGRPQEQPLLLEDLLEQEKREQQRQGPGLMGAAPEEPLLSDFDFERLKADVLSSSNLPASLSPPNVPGQVILPPPSHNQPGKFNRGISSQINQSGNNDWQVGCDNMIGNRGNISQPVEHSTIPLHPALAQSSGSNPIPPANRIQNVPLPSIPAPPTPPEHPQSDQDRQMQAQYEQWLYHQQHVLSLQLKYFETEVNKLRKIKKSLNSKQRQLRKNGGELSDQDAVELDRVTKELTGLQKQLDLSRKQSRQHGLLMQEYRTKQQKRQQLMGMNTGPSQQQSQSQTQASPLGAASHSPLHSTPQSPILSPSPSMGGPVSSPLMQHSPMASPLTPSPGPVPSSLSQTSPRSSIGQPLLHMDDRPFSPNNENSMRNLASPQNNSQSIQNRMPPQQGNNQIRMGSPLGSNQPGLIQQSNNPLMSGNVSMNQNMMMARGMNVNMNSMHQQRPMGGYIDNQRMRPNGPSDQLRMMGPGVQRFPRVGMSQELIMRARSHQNQFQNPNQSQIIMSPGGQHYGNPQRVPFPNQSPTGPNPIGIGMVTNLRSPLPMNSMGSLGSPPGSQVMMGQNRVSPASSPMRRPSGSGSVGVASPLPDRPQSVENPLTPRSTGSGPHTPSSISGNMGCGMDGMQGQHPSSNDGSHFHSMDPSNQQDMNMGSHGMQSYGNFPMTPTSQQQHDFNPGGGGGGNSQVIPFPTFSWFDGPNKGGLKGGSPFSVVNGSPSSHSSNILPEQNQVALENNIATEGFTSVNHTSGASESTSVSSVAANTELVATNAISVDTVESSSSFGNPTIAIVKELKLEAADFLDNKATAHTNMEEPSTSNSMVFFSAAPSVHNSIAVPVSVNKCSLIDTFGLPMDTSESDGIHYSQVGIRDPGNKKDMLEHKLNSENSSDIKKLVVVPKSGMQYLVTGVNNVILPQGMTTSNFQGSSTQTIVDVHSQNIQNIVSVSGSSVLELPPSSLHQANVGVLGGFRPTQNQAMILEQNRLVPIQNISSFDPTKLQNISHVQGTPVSLASFVADAVNAASLPFPQSSKTPGTYVNASVPLITVYSRPEMKNVTGNHHTNLTAVLLTSPRLTTSVSSQQQGLSVAAKVTQAGESQNALLKQLLQNTGCASMNQAPTDTTGFSLTSFAKARPSVSIPVHTSQLSEAASRIPQPTPPVIRPQLSTTIPQAAPIRVPFKIEVRVSESSTVQQPPVPAPVAVPVPLPPPTPPQPTKSPRIAEEDSKPIISEESVVPDPPKETSASNSSIKNVIEVVASDKNSSETTITENKKNDDEVKKAKRRQYQAKKRQSVVKEPTTPKKRIRKGSKLEEDYDSYMENLITQIRQLPPVNIVEPELGPNYNICPIFGAGDYSKINTKGYSLQQGELTGTFGNATVNNQSDYYNTRPFGSEPPLQNPKSQSTHRGFYNQEFASPKTGSYGKYLSDNRSPTPFRETDTPDTIVSSSSPECVLESSSMYPGLKLIDEDEEERLMHLRDSPVIPIFAPIPIRPVQAEPMPKPLADDIDKENISTIPETFVMKAKQTSGGLSPLKDNGNVTVTLTLSSNAAEDIGGVLRNLANVLSISAPSIFQVVERTITPPSQKLGLYTYKGKDGKEIVDIQSILNGSAKFCRHCDVVVLSNVIRKKIRDLPGISPEDSLDGTDDLYFCSTTCFMQFAMTHGVTLPSEDKNKTKSGTEVVGSGLYAQENNLKRPYPSDVKIKEEGEPAGKKWKGIKYKKWGSNVTSYNKYKKPTDKEMTEMLFRMRITVTPSKIPDDSRKCMFCHQIGDGVSDGPGRLLNYDVDKWVHLNCALWSEEVYETENGALVNVELAIKQSLVLLCIACKQRGATVKCFKTRCSSVYHLGCATKDGCVFYKNKTIFCSAHVPKGEKDNELTTLSVFRRVYIQRDENRQVAAVMHHADQHHLLRVGSLIFLNVGQLLPHQLQNFHTANCIYPIGYKIVRFYWSMKRTNKRCQYICSIHEVEGKPEFRISPQDEGTKEVVIKSASAQGAWHQVLDSIVKLRNASSTIKVFPKYITGEDLFGLTEPAIVKVLESLPGIETLTDYHFKYGRNPLLELPLAINPTGCARSEPKLRTHFKRPHTQRTGSSYRTSSAITSSVLSSSEAACPYSKQFVHSKSSQYKKMKQDWRNNVYLARSKIQGLGLYAARDIEKHTMVIEYIGEIIRSELAEAREKKYEAQNRGIYMFRVDEDRVIDATLCGGLARYINHSCNPNCVAETVEVDRDWRIIIFANRRISRGEELAYDYKFEFEDDQHKIQCFCGAPNCRQWMN